MILNALALNRGDDFHTTFSSFAELQSIVPSNVKIFVLTATTTHATLKAVKQCILLQEPVVIGLSPNRPNIFLTVSPHMALELLIVKRYLVI